MGLWPERRAWICINHCDNYVAVGTIVMCEKNCRHVDDNVFTTRVKVDILNSSFEIRFNNSRSQVMNKNTINSISADISATKEQFINELHTVILDAESLLEATTGQADEVVAAARARILESLQVVKDRVAATENAVIERTRQAAKVTDQYVHENPWQSIGVCACAAVIVGILVARR
jgi:ElaB/YqjD/DUF883 family membrane-anchored ribosome-binding protein